MKGKNEQWSQINDQMKIFPYKGTIGTYYRYYRPKYLQRSFPILAAV